MTSRRSAQFRKLFDELPEHARRQAEAAYLLFEQNPQHPGLHFKRVSNHPPLYSVRIGSHYRALGLWEGDTVYWDWIGTHAEYDRFLKSL